jgi:hypothetical protein
MRDTDKGGACRNCWIIEQCAFAKAKVVLKAKVKPWFGSFSWGKDGTEYRLLVTTIYLHILR